MDARPHMPGDGTTEPLPADAPLPPGSDAEEIVDDIDRRIRKRGPEDVEEADEAADEAETSSDRVDLAADGSTSRSTDAKQTDDDTDPTDGSPTEPPD